MYNNTPTMPHKINNNYLQKLLAAVAFLQLSLPQNCIIFDIPNILYAYLKKKRRRKKSPFRMEKYVSPCVHIITKTTYTTYIHHIYTYEYTTTYHHPYSVFSQLPI